jgi:hypothetical protein
MLLAKLSVAIVAAAMVALAAPAHADPDADFANQLHGYGIYGPRDYNAWLGSNHMKMFFNNKGVAAKETDHCADYSPGDQSVWDGSPAR